MTTFNMVVQSRRRSADGSLTVIWWPEIEGMNEIIYHVWTFDPGWTESDVTAYGTDVALFSVFESIELMYPGEYEKGTVI